MKQFAARKQHSRLIIHRECFYICAKYILSDLTLFEREFGISSMLFNPDGESLKG